MSLKVTVCGILERRARQLGDGSAINRDISPLEDERKHWWALAVVRALVQSNTPTTHGALVGVL